MEEIIVETKTTVTMDQIKSMLVGAFEGGSDSWCHVSGYQFPEGISIDDFRDRRGADGPLGKFCDAEEYFHPCQIVPTIDGCAVKLEANPPVNGMKDEWEYKGTNDGEIVCLLLTKEKLIRGVQVMAKVLPKHFRDWMDQNDDADTVDAYLQCCLFPDMIEKDGCTIFC